MKHNNKFNGKVKNNTSKQKNQIQKRIAFHRKIGSKKTARN